MFFVKIEKVCTLKVRNFFTPLIPHKMITLYENEFVTIHWLQEEPVKVLKSVWKDESARMQEENFREIIEKWCELVEEHHPLGSMINSLKFRFTIVPELQDWYNQEITPRTFEAGMRKIAFIVPEEIFSEVSIEQIFNDQEEVIFQYFDNEENAQSWLVP